MDIINQKIVFLDVDGCLTNYNDELGSYITHDPSSYDISSTNLNRISNFCQQNDAKIVISSNWRRFALDGKWIYNKHFYRNPLNSLYNALNDTIIGVLPLDAGLNKCEALNKWFDINHIDKKYFQFVIFDDDNRECFQYDYVFKHHFVKCNPEFGITDLDIEKATTIINSVVGTANKTTLCS